jgi:signal transduction histidine kinase
MPPAPLTAIDSAIDSAINSAIDTAPSHHRRLWLAYGLLSLLAWLLYGVAGTDWQRGTRTLWDGLYEASWNLAPALVLGPAALPWMRWLQQTPRSLTTRLRWHALGAWLFVLAWQVLNFVAAALFFGISHAQASLEQSLVWRGAWGVVIYGALVFGFGNALLLRRANAAALRTAQAEAALVRAELAAITGKLNPHFLFNTLNSLLMLTRHGSAQTVQTSQAEQGLLAFSNLMRYVLDSTRQPDSRVALAEELAFVRSYLHLEQLRLGPRLRVVWQVDPATEEEPIPRLTLQPLVENAINHGIAPMVEGGELHIETSRVKDGLRLQVRDQGPGCVWPLVAPADATLHTPPSTSTPNAAQRQGGVGLAALQRRFALDYGGRARFTVRTAPGQGFAVDIFIPYAD